MRAVFRSRIAVCGDVVNFLLTFRHAGYIIRQGNGLRGGVFLRAGKTQQFGDQFRIGAVLARTFFQNQAELLPECLVFFRVIIGQFFQHLQNTFGQGAAQAAGDGAVL